VHLGSTVAVTCIGAVAVDALAKLKAGNIASAINNLILFIFIKPVKLYLFLKM
jgi:hypothetical protein